MRRGPAITNQMLRFHKQSTNARSVFCQELIEGGLSIYQGRILNAGISVEKRKRASNPVTCFDGEICQVLNTLVSNAIDAMHPKAGRLIPPGRQERAGLFCP